MLPPSQLEESWKDALKQEWSKPYLNDLATFVANERASGAPIYPQKTDVFSAFNHAPFDKTNVVIVGQDPYHGPGQAHGLSFSVPPSVPQPPSLKNIFKELQNDLSITPSLEGSLVSWAKQGVLMLNAVLTVRAHQPYSHSGKGWELFTNAVLACLYERADPVIFVLWGKAAQEKCRSVLSEKANRAFVLTAPHPSPFSAHSGFFGCHHFSKINELLKRQRKKPINWAIS